MRKICDRVNDFTGPDGCYSLDVERALIWDSLTPTRRAEPSKIRLSLQEARAW